MEELSKLKHHVSRILTFDLMRGYFLIAIIIDHLNFFPSTIDWWSARGGLFVTTAEGFFLISGIVLGIVRGSKLVDEPFKKVAKLLLNRAVQLYLTCVVMILLFTFLGWWFFIDNPGLKLGIKPVGTDYLTVIWQTLTFQYYYGWADYLRLYALFLFASPLVFWLLRQGKWYVVLALSLLVWSLFPDSPFEPYERQDALMPVSWQLLFFGGTIIGFHWNSIVDKWRHLAAKTRRILTVGVLAVAGITLAFNILIMLSTMGYDFNAWNINAKLQENLYIAFFDKERMPLGRIALALVWFWAAFYLFKKFEPIIMRFIGWLLLPFGTNSLYVYTLHALAIFFAHIYLKAGDFWYNSLVTIAIILVIRVMIHYKVLMNIIPR